MHVLDYLIWVDELWLIINNEVIKVKDINKFNPYNRRSIIKQWKITNR